MSRHAPGQPIVSVTDAHCCLLKNNLYISFFPIWLYIDLHLTFQGEYCGILPGDGGFFTGGTVSPATCVPGSIQNTEIGSV
jgi:hypothetical protein